MLNKTDYKRISMYLEMLLDRYENLAKELEGESLYFILKFNIETLKYYIEELSKIE